jgi:hypothetical protein
MFWSISSPNSNSYVIFVPLNGMAPAGSGPRISAAAGCTVFRPNCHMLPRIPACSQPDVAAADFSQ